MDTRSDWKQRYVAVTGLIGCLLLSGTLGLLMGSEPVMGASVVPERGEYRVPEDATVTADQAYMQISARSHYQATADMPGRQITYTVQPGDSLWQIANIYDTDPSTLFSLNEDLESTVIQPGQELVVLPGFRGLRHTVEWGETLSEIASIYEVSIYDIIELNQVESGDLLLVGQELLVPGAEARQERTMVASSRSGGSRRTSGQALGWIWPITGGLHSSEYGESRWGGVHTGIDIAVPTGTPAAAVGDGTVLFSGWDGGYGYCVIIDHGGGIQTRYAHASKLLVSHGQSVSQGEDVILVGGSGNSTGPHLHFEVLVDGEALNPRLYLP